jgi:hypothetical protein
MTKENRKSRAQSRQKQARGGVVQNEVDFWCDISQRIGDDLAPVVEVGIKTTTAAVGQSPCDNRSYLILSLPTMKLATARFNWETLSGQVEQEFCREYSRTVKC